MSYNIFNHAHRPLKLALLEGCIKLQDVAEDHKQIEQAIGKLEQVLEVFEQQLRYEAEVILPMIFDYEPSIWNLYTSEHHKASNLARKIWSLLKSFPEQTNHTNHSVFISYLTEAYNQFVLFNYSHMDDEEPVLNEILWRYYEDSYIRNIGDGFNIIYGETKISSHPNYPLPHAA